MQFQASGVIPAALMPWTPDMAMDLPGLRRHLADLAGVRGVTAVCVNGHASEVMSCTEDEQAAILSAAVDEIGSRLPVVGGVYSESSIAAASHARRWDALGASALLVVPPQAFGKGAQLRPEMVVEHYSRIAAVTDLPLIIFQYTLAGGQAHSLETMIRLAEAIPTICAVKDYCGDPVLHEQAVRHLQNGPRRVNVLTAHSAWLLQSLALGCAGILSGAGSTIAPLQVELFEAMQAGDLARARAVNERIAVPNGLFYRPPFADQHNRMKEAQVMMGRFAHAVVRPPLMKLPAAEIAAIRAGLLRAGLIANDR
jgi:4-hydroxy-tetrahydrodipicolinate synthase